MEEKEKILFTILGIVAIIAIVGLIGIFNKPTYILIPLQTSPETETQQTAISGMAVYDLSREQCLRYKSVYSQYAWFDDWQFFKDNCEAKYDISEPEGCEIGYLDEYKCDQGSEYLLRKWQNSRCDTGWRYFQYCKNGCLNGKCKTESEICTEKYLYDYRCDNGNSQRLYQNTDCTTEYKDFEICKKGCDQKTGRCNKVIESYTSGFLDEYKCSGDYLQRAYQYSNGVKEYLSIQFCSKGCSDNKCN